MEMVNVPSVMITKGVVLVIGGMVEDWLISLGLVSLGLTSSGLTLSRDVGLMRDTADKGWVRIRDNESNKSTRR